MASSLWRSLRIGRSRSQKGREVRIQHATARVRAPNRCGELEPALPISRLDLLLRHERALVQQRDAVPLSRKIR